MSEMRIWFPCCLECKSIESFAGPLDLSANEIKCPMCGMICEDASAMHDRGDLEIIVDKEAFYAAMAEQDKRLYAMGLSIE